MGRIVINVSGWRYTTTTETLARFPNTKLGRLYQQQTHNVEHFFDADEDVFREVLRYYRTGELHAPQNMCLEIFNRELKFWGISEMELEECCQSAEMSDSELEQQFLKFEKRIEIDGTLTRKDKLWYFLTDPNGPYTKKKKFAVLWCLLFAGMVIMQIMLVAATTLPSIVHLHLNAENGTYRDAIVDQFKNPCVGARHWLDTSQSNIPVIWYISTAFFITEIVVRLISCPSKTYFFRSFHALDAGIAFLEFAQYIVVFPFADLIIEDEFNEDLCSMVVGINTLVYFTSQLRCFRLLVFCTNIR